MAAETRVHIGTSGWHYKHWLGNFYPEKLAARKMFAHYAEQFDTVELNNSFYRLPEPETFAAWRDAAPRNFTFAVKASRFITHNKKLKDPEHALNNLLPRAEVLGEKLGPVLFQLPPAWRVNLERLEEFLEALPKHLRYTFELREHSWLTPEVFALLRRYNAAFCIYELAGFRTPMEITADWTYVRLHGPTGRKYQGSYTGGQLEEWAARIEKWKRELRAVYIYFDNDQAGYAAANAIELKRRVEAAGKRSAA